MSRRDANTTKVFVGSLPATVTTDDLRGLFTPYGNIVECDIANRCGFLHLEDKDLAMKAIEELNNTNFMGGKISVERGRVKPPRRSREGGVSMRGGGRDRAGPYARNEGYARGPPPRNGGMGGGYGGDREYGAYGERYDDYDRGAPARSYGQEYETIGERRPLFDDRRGGYMHERRPYGSPNGYERRSFEDRGGYPDERSGGYDDRHLPPALNSYDDRRLLMADRRPLLDQGGGYDRGSSGNDMFSRRGDSGPKQGLPSSDGYDTSLGYDNSGVSGGGYSSVNDGGYGTSSGAGYSTGDGNYGSSSGYGAGGYNEGRSQSGGYGNASGGTGGSYGTGSAGAYNTSVGGGGYGDSYNSSRVGGSYDTAYPIPQQRSFASSSGGPGPRGGGDIPPGAGRRF